MELSNVDHSDTADASFLRRRGQNLSGSAGHVDIYEPAQDILDACNRDLEELRMKILKSSVRCHMLEVDLATQFNPQNQQLYADAEDACQKCCEAIHSISQDVSQGRTTPAATQKPISTTPATTEQQVSVMSITPTIAVQQYSSMTITPGISEEQGTIATVSTTVAEKHVSTATTTPAIAEQQVLMESATPPTEKGLAGDAGQSAGDSQDFSVVADCMEEGSQ